MTEELSVPKGPGRPPKKGKPTWKPANVDDVVDKEDGFRYRWINAEPKNIAKKQAEQWEIVSDIAGSQTTSEAGYGRIDAGKHLTSVREGQGRILARLPEDVAVERDAYVNGKTARMTAALKRQTRDDLGKSGAPIHGGISIEQRGIRTVIKE